MKALRTIGGIIVIAATLFGCFRVVIVLAKVVHSGFWFTVKFVGVIVALSWVLVGLFLAKMS